MNSNLLAQKKDTMKGQNTSTRRKRARLASIEFHDRDRKDRSLDKKP